MILSQYKPESGIMVFGQNEYQQATVSYNSVFNFVSNILTDISFNLLSRNYVDACWESGNIYYINQLDNKVRKISFDGTELAELQLANPTSISIIQNSNKMIIEETAEDKGCWIIDGTNVYKTDKDLNVIKTISNLTSPLFVQHSKYDDGCFVLDNSLGILRFSTDGDLIGTGNLPTLTINDIKTNSYGDLFILSKNNLYKCVLNGGSISLSFDLDLSPYFVGMSVSCIDIDTSTTSQYVYIGGGTDELVKLVKFDKNGTYVNAKLLDGEFPYVIKVSQHPTSSMIYVLGDKSKYADFESSSSSNSSGS